MQQDKQYNIAAITGQLKTKFSQLALIPDELLNNPDRDLHYLLAKRNGQLTLSVFLPTLDMSVLLTSLGQSMPTAFEEFLQNCQALIVDLDSITQQGPWRFYVRERELNREWANSRFPQTEAESIDPASATRLEGLGFYFDPASGQVTQYKWYWFNLENRVEVRQRFGAQGNFLNSQQVVSSTNLADQSLYSNFNIDGIDFTDFMLKYHYQSDLDQQYITVTKDTRNAYTKYIGQSFGSMPVEPSSLLDPSEQRPFVNPTDWQINPT
jgi:hypothetical protein